MKLFVFVPYQWDYCGGALGVVAEDYNEAVSILRAYRERNALYGVTCPSGYVEKNEFRHPYGDRALFMQPSEKDLAKKDESNQWILEYSVGVDDTSGSRIVFDNWNFA